MSGSDKLPTFWAEGLTLSQPGSIPFFPELTEFHVRLSPLKKGRSDPSDHSNDPDSLNSIKPRTNLDHHTQSESLGTLGCDGFFSWIELDGESLLKRSVWPSSSGVLRQNQGVADFQRSQPSATVVPARSTPPRDSTPAAFEPERFDVHPEIGLEPLTQARGWPALAVVSGRRVVPLAFLSTSWLMASPCVQKRPRRAFDDHPRHCNLRTDRAGSTPSPRSGARTSRLPGAPT